MIILQSFGKNVHLFSCPLIPGLCCILIISKEFSVIVFLLTVSRRVLCKTNLALINILQCTLKKNLTLSGSFNMFLVLRDQC